MKDLKNKEVIAGLIIIIILGSIALFLLIRREIDGGTFRQSAKQQEKEAYKESISVKEEKEDSFFISDDGVREKNESEKSAETVTVSNTTEDEKNSNEKKRYTLYTILGSEKYQAKSMKQRKTEDGQLEELYQYWDAYQLDAVGEIIRLDRVRKIVEELEGKDIYYYYGSTDSLGRASGKGLAVYADYSFYFGEWKEGLRDGKGMWIQPAVYDDNNKYADLGLLEHNYNGEWKKDLPNGEGQEHFSYDYDILKEDYLAYGFAIANVLGEFKDGYYHGEMYVMTADEAGRTTDWSGICEYGEWKAIMEGSTTDAIWQSYETDEQGNYFYHYVFPKENKGYGIHGLMK